MTITLFMTILTVGASVSSVLTEALKGVFKAYNVEYSANLIAIINGVFVGCGGCCVFYSFLDIPFTLNNILCLVLMGFSVALGSMVGYDKVIQLVNQIKDMK